MPTVSSVSRDYYLSAFNDATGTYTTNSVYITPCCRATTKTTPILPAAETFFEEGDNRAKFGALRMA